MKNMYNYAAPLRCSALMEKAHGKQQSFKRFDNVQCSTESQLWTQERREKTEQSEIHTGRPSDKKRGKSCTDAHVCKGLCSKPQ